MDGPNITRHNIIVNKKKIEVCEECEFIYHELMDIYNGKAFDAGLEWEDKYEEFVYALAQDILLEVDKFRADLITNEPTHSTPWDEEV
jgi:hypothetical protein